MRRFDSVSEENSNHIEKITRFIIDRVGSGSNTVIALCGAADIGKSYLSSELAQSLEARGISANCLMLDSFLMNRSDRIKNNLSGYDAEAYDFESIAWLLTQFQLGQSISYFPYDHPAGTNSSTQKTIMPCKVLIIDGLHAMHKTLKSFCSLRLFVFTDDEQLRSIRRKADAVKRKQAPEVSERLEPLEFEAYKRQVEPYKKDADLLIYLRRKWEYRVEIV